MSLYSRFLLNGRNAERHVLEACLRYEAGTATISDAYLLRLGLYRAKCGGLTLYYEMSVHASVPSSIMSQVIIVQSEILCGLLVSQFHNLLTMLTFDAALNDPSYERFTFGFNERLVDVKNQIRMLAPLHSAFTYLGVIHGITAAPHVRDVGARYKYLMDSLSHCRPTDVEQSTPNGTLPEGVDTTNYSQWANTSGTMVGFLKKTYDMDDAVLGNTITLATTAFKLSGDNRAFFKLTTYDTKGERVLNYGKVFALYLQFSKAGKRIVVQSSSL